MLYLTLFAGIAAAAATVKVTVGPGKVYIPQNITISPGDTVTWTFAGGYHNVEESESPSAPCSPKKDNVTIWTSGKPVGNGTWTRTFDKAGVYSYRCSVGDHCKEGQWGIVTVGDGGSAKPPGSATATTMNVLAAILLPAAAVLYAQF